MHERYKKSDLTKIADKTVFFDANVLLYIFWPLTARTQQVRKYSELYGRLIKQKNKLAVNETVISEVINRALRIEFDNSSYTSAYDYKSFRNTTDGKTAQADIFTTVKNKILTNFQVVNKSFSADELKQMLNVDNLDFNDKIISNICATNNMILLTNDADFSNETIDILSANPKLCP